MKKAIKVHTIQQNEHVLVLFFFIYCIDVSNGSLQDVSNNFIRSDGAKAFSEMLNENTTLKTLSLKGRKINEHFCYRSGTVNSKSFVGKDFLLIKWKFKLNYAL